MTLRTRRPSGAPTWPVILFEGVEKSGRTYACALASASETVGRTLWLDFGHGTADEYAAVPGADYEILVHDGTYASVLTQLSAARDEAARALADGEPPMMLVVNSMTALWEAIRNWSQQRVANSAENRRRLRTDPFAEISLGDSGWNEANGRHARIMHLLLTFPGVVLLTARGKWITPVTKDGTPDGLPFYRVDAHRSVPSDATCWVRLDREAPAQIIGARAPALDLHGEPLPLDPDWTLDTLLELLDFHTGLAQVRNLITARAERPPSHIAAEAIAKHTTAERLTELLTETETLGYQEAEVPNERNRPEPLQRLLQRLHRARQPDAPAAAWQRTRMVELWDRAGDDFYDPRTREAYVQQVTGRHVTDAAGLTRAEADQIIARLEVYLQQQIQPDVPTGQSNADQQRDLAEAGAST